MPISLAEIGGRQVAKAEKAVAQKATVKRNRFIRLAEGIKTVNQVLQAKNGDTEDAQGAMASNLHLPCGSHCQHYCVYRAYMERTVSVDQLEQAGQHRVWRCGFRA